MKIVITDSGLGGMDVAAKLFSLLQRQPLATPIELCFVNALPETHGGYNTMPDERTKTTQFDRVLWGIERYCAPDYIAIACNTLSALAAHTSFFKAYPKKLFNIIEWSVQQFFSAHPALPQSPILIFATETTIQSKEYSRLLKEGGVSESLLFPVPCPGLASAIEYDSESTHTQALVCDCVSHAARSLKQKALSGSLFVFLACTHYGYVASLFKSALQAAGHNDVRLINPNDYFVDLLYTTIQNSLPSKIPNSQTSLTVYSRCPILPAEIASISKLIRPVSAQAAAALETYQIKEDLF